MTEKEKKRILEQHAKQRVMLEQVSMTHVKLAMRMALRDPGNKPMINERIPYVKIEKFAPRGVKLLQGDMVEHPEYIIQNNLQIDYLFYMTNQIINPCVQLLDLIIPNSKDEIFKKIIDKHTDKKKERQTLELQKLHLEETTKTMNEFVTKYNWAKFESDDEDSWMPMNMDMTKMINEIKAETKTKKTRRKKVVA